MIDNNELLRLHNRLAARRINDKEAMEQGLFSLKLELQELKEKLDSDLQKARLQRWGLLFCIAILMFKVFL